MASDSRKNSKSAARDAAAQAKAAAAAEQKKRERLITIIGVAVVAVIIAAVVGIVLVANNSNTSGVALPLGVDSKTYGLPVGTAASSTPFVQLFEDFQCPSCDHLEKVGGVAALEAAAKAGKFRLQLQPMTFLDQNLNNDSSIRATNAWGCAIDQGVGVQYHSIVFQNQPAKEGAGYTDAVLIQFGKLAGLTGAKYNTFAACVPTIKYHPWANAAENYASNAGVTGTPTIHVNGKEMPLTAATYNDPAKLVAAVIAAGKK
jgi:protein-disulfide isomerase